MARAPPVWESYGGCYYAGGDRDVLLIASHGPLPTPSPAVVPRCEVRVAELDCRKLVNQGVELAPDLFQDDLAIIRARIKLDKSLELVGEEISSPGNILSKNHVVQRIENVFKATCKSGGNRLRLM